MTVDIFGHFLLTYLLTLAGWCFLGLKYVSTSLDTLAYITQP